MLSDAPQAWAAAAGPCDIYASGGTPCVAAHSTTRPLYGAYSGPLYQVRRSSDNTTRDVRPLSVGGYAKTPLRTRSVPTRPASSPSSTTSPAGTTGSPRRLRWFPRPRPGGWDNLADAKAAPITIGGQKAYGVYIAPGTGYRNNNTNGVATGDQPEGIYATTASLGAAPSSRVC